MGSGCSAAKSRYKARFQTKVDNVLATTSSISGSRRSSKIHGTSSTFRGVRHPCLFYAAFETRRIVDISCGWAGKHGFLASGDCGGLISLWDMPKKKLEMAWPWHMDRITCMVVLENFDLNKAKRNVTSRKSMRRLMSVEENRRKSFLQAIIPTKVTKYLGTGSIDGHLKAMEIGTARLVADVDLKEPISCCVECKSGDIVVGFKGTGDLKVVSLEANRVLMVLYGHRCKSGFMNEWGHCEERCLGINALIRLTDGKIGSAGEDGKVKLWESSQDSDTAAKIPGQPAFGVSSCTFEAPTHEEWMRVEAKRARPMKMYVRVVKAEHVPIADAWFAGGKADPYVVLKIVDRDPDSAVSQNAGCKVLAESTSPVKYNTLFPEWDWRCELDLPALSMPLYLLVTLLDYDMDIGGVRRDDDVLGQLTLPLADALVDTKTGTEGKKAKDFRELQAYSVQPSPHSPKNYNLEKTKITMAFRVVTQDIDGPTLPSGPKLPTMLPADYSTITGATALAECGRGSKRFWRLLVGYADGIVCIWDLFDIHFGTEHESNLAGRPLFRIQAHNASVTCAAWMQKANRAVTAGLDAKVKLWQADASNLEVARLAPTLQLLDAGGWVYDAHELADGCLVAAVHRTSSHMAFWD